MHLQKGDIGNILLLSAVCFLSILIVNPTGNFPLNDDWAYALSVKHWQEFSEFKLFNWGEMTLVAHVIWGIFFSSFSEFSFTILRWSTVVLSILGVIGIYSLLREIKLNRQFSFIGALLLFFNPIYFSLSLSYMTDVPFVTTSIFALIYLIRYQRSYSRKHLLFSLFFLIWGILIKQLMLVLPLAFWLSQLIKDRKFKLNSALPFLYSLLIYFSYTLIMKYFGMLPEHYNNKLGLIISNLFNFELKFLRNIPGYSITIFTYLGLFLFPFHFKLFYKSPLKSKVVLHGLSFIITLILFYFNKLIPSLDNVWVDFGIGPTTLFDHYGNLKNAPHFQAPILLKVTLTYIGFYSAAHLIQYIIISIQNEWSDPKLEFEQIFSITSIIIYCSPFVLVGIYDRYLIWLIPFFLVLLIKSDIKFSGLKLNIISYVFLFLMAAFSVSATHDYLSWNRVRWETISRLLENGAQNDEIHGGIEYSTWYHFDENDPKWYVNETEEKFVLSFTRLDGFEVEETFYYEKWMPGSNVIYLNKRN